MSLLQVSLELMLISSRLLVWLVNRFRLQTIMTLDPKLIQRREKHLCRYLQRAPEQVGAVVVQRAPVISQDEGAVPGPHGGGGRGQVPMGNVLDGLPHPHQQAQQPPPHHAPVNKIGYG